MKSGKRTDIAGGFSGYLVTNILIPRMGTEVTIPSMVEEMNDRLKAQGLKPVTGNPFRVVVARMVAAGVLEVVSEAVKGGRGNMLPAVYRVTAKVTGGMPTKKVAAVDPPAKHNGRAKAKKSSLVVAGFDEIDARVAAEAEEIRARLIKERAPELVNRITSEQAEATAILDGEVARLKEMGAATIDGAAEQLRKIRAVTEGMLESVGALVSEAEGRLNRDLAKIKALADKILELSRASESKIEKASKRVEAHISERVRALDAARADLSRLACADCHAEQRRIREASDRLRQAQDRAINNIRAGATAVISTGRE